MLKPGKMNSDTPAIGIIGDNGLYRMEELRDATKVQSCGGTQASGVIWCGTTGTTGYFE